MARDHIIDIGIVDRSARKIGYIDQIDPTTLSNRSDGIDVEGYERIAFQMISGISGTSSVRLECVYSIDGTNWIPSGYDAFRPVDGIYTFNTRNFPIVALEVSAIDAAESTILFAWHASVRGDDRDYEPISTGVTHGGDMSISGNNININRGSGVIVDSHSDGLEPVSKLIYWDDTSINGTLSLTTNSIFIFMQANGVPTFTESISDFSDVRSMVFLGSAVYDSSGAPLRVVSTPHVSATAAATLGDVLTTIFSRQGLFISGSSGDLSIDNSAGILIRPGINWQTSRSDPNRVSISSGTSISFDYALADGSIYSSSNTALDNLSYESGGAGSVTSIGGVSSQSTIQHVFVAIDGTFRVMYGQTVYADLATGVNSLALDLDGLVIEKGFLAEHCHLVSVVFTQDCSDISSQTDCRIIDAYRGPFGSPFVLSG